LNPSFIVNFTNILREAFSPKNTNLVKLHNKLVQEATRKMLVKFTSDWDTYMVICYTNYINKFLHRKTNATDAMMSHFSSIHFCQISSMHILTALYLDFAVITLVLSKNN